MKTDMITIETKKDARGHCHKLRVVFGPHYFLEVESTKSGKTEFRLGATHHGFKADATEVNGELEQIISEIRRLHPGSVID